MMQDVLTVAWKEWRELFAREGRLGGGRANFVLMLLAFGVLAPWQFGAAWVTSPLTLLYWGWVPLLLLSHVVVDAFAGERERHTLETLLASRLPDAAILLGKVAAAVGYALLVTGAGLLLGAITVNLRRTGDALVLYPASMIAGSLVATALGATLIAALGVLVSLRAATVRQAGQMMGLAVLAVAFGPVLAWRGDRKSVV